MDTTKLKTEVTTDPLERGYAGMTDAEAADSLNTADRPQAVESVSGQDLFEAAVPADYAALSDADKAMFHALIGMGTIKVGGANTRAALLRIFGAGTQTRANLAALQTRMVSRAAELGLPVVRARYVRDARAVQ